MSTELIFQTDLVHLSASIRRRSFALLVRYSNLYFLFWHRKPSSLYSVVTITQDTSHIRTSAALQLDSLTMCRWFAYISPEEPCLLSDVLISPANSIARQCSEHFLPKLLPHHEDKDLSHADDRLMRLRNSLLNMDGLGVAWYSNAQTDYVKNVGGARPGTCKHFEILDAKPN